MRSLGALEVSLWVDRPPRVPVVKRARVTAARLVAAILFAGACVPASPAAISPTLDSPVRGGRLVIALSSGPTTLDPLRVADGALEGPVTQQIYEPLVGIDRLTGEIVPGLATWSASADGTTYEFDIAANATWSDGAPIVAEDMVTAAKAFARSKVSASPRMGISLVEGFSDYKAGKAAGISGLRADGKHLTVRLGRVFCPALGSFLLTPPLPSHVFGRYLSDTDVSKNADDAPEHLAPPVASGPFVFTQWRRGEEILLRANERYWRGRPRLDELAFRILDLTAGLTAFRNGIVHLGWGGYPTGGGIARQLESDPGFKVVRFPYPGYTFIAWNTRSQAVPALRDKRIRQALAYGLDIELGVERILDGEGVVTRQHMDVTSWARAPGLERYPYDPAKAEALIRSAGYTKGADGIYQRDGIPLALTIVTNEGNETREKVIQFATDQYRNVGIRVTPKREPFAPLVDRLFKGDPTSEGVVLGWSGRLDPYGTAIWHSPAPPAIAPQNLAWYTDPDLDKAVDEGRFGPDCSIAARKRAYELLDRRLNEDQPYNFLFTVNVLMLMSSRVHGLVPGPYSPTPDAHLWWLVPK